MQSVFAKAACGDPPESRLLSRHLCSPDGPSNGGVDFQAAREILRYGRNACYCDVPSRLSVAIPRKEARSLGRHETDSRRTVPAALLNTAMYADIAVCLPLVRTFVYRVNESVETGCRVIVPFRKREVEGFVVNLRKDAPRDLEVHDIRSLVDRSPLVRPDIFKLCRWIADYYISPLGEVLKGALPPGILPKHVERGPGVIRGQTPKSPKFEEISIGSNLG